MKMPDSEGTTFYSETTPIPKKKDNAYLVGLRQWGRLKKDVKNIPTGFDWWTVAWSVSFGASTAFLGVAITAENYRDWYWSLTGVFFAAFLISLVGARKISKVTGSNKENVLNRMAEVEEDHEDPGMGSGAINSTFIRYNYNNENNK